jgi:hypothetical protein
MQNLSHIHPSPTRHHAAIHTVDQSDLIIDVNDLWLHFAQENEGAHLSYDQVVGRSLWTFIAGAEAPHLYHILMRQVRQSQRRMVFTYRCDSSSVRRYMQMELVPLDEGALQFKNYLLFEEPRDPAQLLDFTGERTDELLRMCSWCSRIECDGTWLPVEEAVLYLGLFGSPHLPQITHGICPNCVSLFERLS